MELAAGLVNSWPVLVLGAIAWADVRRNQFRIYNNLDKRLGVLEVKVTGEAKDGVEL